MELVAHGLQDVYLTGNPQITFFKIVHRRHTNFSIEAIPQTLNGNIGLGNRITAQISRIGDLMHKIFLRVTIPEFTLSETFSSNGGLDYDNCISKFFLADNLGYALLNSVDIDIGGQRLDRHYGHWMQIWNELSLPSGKDKGFARMIGKKGSGDPVLETALVKGIGPTYKTNSGSTPGVFPPLHLSIPLEFWFCRNPGLALPLIALQYHDVKVNFEFNKGVNLGWSEVTIATVANDAVILDNIDSSTSGTAGTWITGVLTEASGLSELDSHYVNKYLFDKTNSESKLITAYDGTTKTITVDSAFTGTIVAGSDLFEIREPNGQTETYKLTVSDGYDDWSGLETTLTQTATAATKTIRGPIVNDVNIPAPELYVDYIFLDTDERRRFAQSSHEYLFEQLQFLGSEITDRAYNSLRLNFNHPVKEIIWTAQPSANVSTNNNNMGIVSGQFDYQWWGPAAAPLTYMSTNETDIPSMVYGTTGELAEAKPLNPVKMAVIQLNGHDRFRERTGEYFSQVQPYQCHERIPNDKGINLFSFALRPEDHQPTGTINLSRVDMTQLNLTLHNSEEHTIRVYATNYNVLRITSGMGGIAFAQ